MDSAHPMESPREAHPARRPRTWRRWLLTRGGCLLGVYLLVVFMFAVFQRSLIYQPARATALGPEQAMRPEGQVHALRVLTADNLELHGWHLLATGHAAHTAADLERQWKSGRPVVLFFPGNGGHRQYRLDDFALLNDLGADVVAFDYRGYGENSGSPTEAGMAEDARSIWQFLVDEQQLSPRQIVIFGESLGGGVATRLATELCQAGTPPRGLILRSTFANLADAGAAHYPWLPVHWLLLDRFDSLRRIPRMTAPLLMLHGELDQVVPISQGRQLFDAAPQKSASGISKRFVALPRADHNDVLVTERRLVIRAIETFLASVDDHRSTLLGVSHLRLSAMGPNPGFARSSGIASAR